MHPASPDAHRRRQLATPPAFFLGGGLLVCLAVACLLVVVPPESKASITPSDYEKYYWQDTKYRDIRTRTVKSRGATYDSTVEYPVTKNAEVNQVIIDAVNAFDQSFHAAIANRLPVAGEKFEQHTSYQVVRMHGDFLSVEVVTTRDTQGATLEHDTAYWTFNLATGHEITLSDLFGASDVDGEARLFLYIKQDIARQVAKKGIPYDATKVDAVVNRETMRSFLAPDANTIRFDFGQGTLASEFDGPITVSLPTANLQLFLQSSKTKGLFDIMPIVAVPEWQAPIVSKGSVDCTHAKCIALTFDDGPGPLTSQLLDTLKRHHAHASFFLIGHNIDRYQAVVKRMQSEGHTIGNHSWDHRAMPTLGLAALDSEVSQTNTTIQMITGVKPNYMRPPNGALSLEVYAALKRANMTAVMWSIDTRDWADRNSDIVYNRVISGAKPGSIIILHDIHKTSVEAVPRILATLQRQGYAFVSIEELFGPNAAPGSAISHAS